MQLIKLRYHTIFFLVVFIFTSATSYSQRFSLRNPSILIENGANFSKISYQKNSGGNKDLESNRNLGYTFTIKGLIVKDIQVAGMMFGLAYKRAYFNPNLKTNSFINTYLSDNEFEYNINYSINSFGALLYFKFFNDRKFDFNIEVAAYFNKLNNNNIIVKQNGTELPNNQTNSCFTSDCFRLDSKWSNIISFGTSLNSSKRIEPTVNIGLELYHKIFLRYTDASYRIDNIFFNIGLQYKLYKPE